MPLGEFLAELFLPIFEATLGFVCYRTGILLTMLTFGKIRAGDPIHQYKLSGFRRRVRRQRREENPVRWWQTSYVRDGQRYLFAESTTCLGALFWVIVFVILVMVAIERGWLMDA